MTSHTELLVQKPIEIAAPIDGFRIPNLRHRMVAWKALARKKYMAEPACFSRGKTRFDSIIMHRQSDNTILWNANPLPQSKMLLTNVLPGSRLGQVVLVLMVKNEGKIIRRMLETVKDHIDGFIILDTGSTDNTVDLMWNILHKEMGKRGTIYQCPFHDFASNRSIVVQLAYNAGDWLLLFDADYKLVCNDKQWRKNLAQWDAQPRIGQLLLFTEGNMKYSRPHLVRGDVRWCYVARTHECLGVSKYNTGTRGGDTATFHDLLIDHVSDGGSKHDKVPRDIVFLMMDLLDDPESVRAHYYLGNSLVGIGMNVECIDTYHDGQNLMGWYEERYNATIETFNAMKNLNEPLARQMVNFLYSSNINAQRLELPTKFLRHLTSLRHSSWNVAHYKQSRGLHLAATLGSFFTHNEYPSEQKLFVDANDHTFAFWHELILICANDPLYFDLGCFLSRRLMASKEFLEKGAKEQKDRRTEYLEKFDLVADGLVTYGTINTDALRQRLIDLGEKALGQNNISLAMTLFQATKPTVVSRSLLPFMEASDGKWFATPVDAKFAAKAKSERQDMVKMWFEEFTHKLNPLTSWKDGKSVKNPQLGSLVTSTSKQWCRLCMRLADCEDRYLQMEERENKSMTQEEKDLHKGNRIAYFLDALKCDPNYAPASSALYDMTNWSTSSWTRTILYGLRMVQSSRLKTAAEKEQSLWKSTPNLVSIATSEWIAIDEHGNWKLL